ncbi:MAG: conjugal transfer protein TrbI [Cyanobacteria bacterium]|nr:conjugal transfer protein TrbI [Cyanobacteria bacterium bin.51]
MTTTLQRPVKIECACPSCHCAVQAEGSFCSDACAKGHPNGEACHLGCGCECNG